MARADIRGRLVAITGGARGIGRATAARLAAEGATVAIGDLDETLARRTATELGRNVHAYTVDVTDRDSFAAFLDAVEADLGPLDVLVNNAGIMLLGPFTAQDDDSIDLQIDVNLKGVLYGMKLAAPRMVARGGGHIVNLASMVGKAGYRGGVTYSATKHAVVGATEALRSELRDTGVQVSTVMPAVVNTELGSGLPSVSVPPVDPADVAEVILHVLETRKAEAMVPRWLWGLTAFTSVLPPTWRAAIGRAMKADGILWDTDTSTRAAYVDRVRGGARRPVGDGAVDDGAVDATDRVG